MTSHTRDKVSVYGKNLKAQAVPTGNSRDTDSRALAVCARRLDEARGVMQRDPKSRDNLKVYGDAIRQNQRLWTIFQVALCDPLNPLPENLKITLLNLSRYVDKASFRAIGKYAPDVLDSLINVNRLIASGLSRQTSADNYAPPPPDMRDIPTSLMTSA